MVGCLRLGSVRLWRTGVTRRDVAFAKVHLAPITPKGIGAGRGGGGGRRARAGYGDRAGACKCELMQICYTKKAWNVVQCEQYWQT